MENDENLRAAVKIMVLKETAAWQSDRRQYLDKIKSLENKLFAAEQQNEKLKADLYRGKSGVEQIDNKISSLNHRLSALEEKRAQQVTSLQQSLRTQKEETKKVRATATTKLEKHSYWSLFLFMLFMNVIMFIQPTTTSTLNLH